MGEVQAIPPEFLNHKPSSNVDADVKSLAYRLLAVEDRIDAENKLKAVIFAEAKLAGVDVGALKATVRTIRYLPQSNAGDLPALRETVKRYLTIAIPTRRMEG